MHKISRKIQMGLNVLTAAAAALACTPAFADALLSGTIKTSDGKPLDGVTVSAKPDGGTITTGVFTDENGQYYFPPLPTGHYRVWAQALSFQTAKKRRRPRCQPQAGFIAGADERCRSDVSAAAGQPGARRAAGRYARTSAYEAHRTHGLHRLPHAKLSAAASL